MPSAMSSPTDSTSGTGSFLMTTGLWLSRQSQQESSTRSTVPHSTVPDCLTQIRDPCRLQHPKARESSFCPTSFRTLKIEWQLLYKFSPTFPFPTGVTCSNPQASGLFVGLRAAEARADAGGWIDSEAEMESNVQTAVEIVP